MVATKRSKGMTPSKTHTPPMCRGISLHSKLRNAASSAPKRAGSWGSAMNASLRETRILRLYCLVIHGGMQGAARGKGKVNRLAEIGAAQTSAIALTADPAPGGSALKPGIYEGQVTVTYAAVSVSVKAHLIIGGLGANLRLSETGLTFQGGEGGYPSHSANIEVENLGVGTLADLTAKTSVTGGGANWLHAVITPIAGNPQASTVAISVDPLPAAVGTYYGRVDFLLPGAANSPQSVTVALEIMPGPPPDITPGSVVVGTDYTWGQPNVPTLSQTVKLSNIGKRTLTFTLTGGAGTLRDQAAVSFVAFSPKSGSIGPGGSASFTVSVPRACWGL